MTKQKGQVQIRMCDNTRDPFIATLHNVLLATDLCDRLFSSITLMNLVHTCLFQKGFCNVYSVAKDKNAVTIPHSTQRKQYFWEEIKEMSKTKKFPSREKISLELSGQRLGHRFTRSLLAGGTANVWEDVELRIDPDLFEYRVKFLQ